jgi:DNA polymerase IV
MIACVEGVCPTPLIRGAAAPAVGSHPLKPERRGAQRMWLSAGWLSAGGGRVAKLPGIVHVHLDSFYATIEQTLSPRLRGKAVAVLSGGLVASASLEAQRRGVTDGMKIREARKLCPNAIFVPGEYSRYADFAERVRRILETCSPSVEMAAFGSFYLDFSGATFSCTDFEATLRRMQADILGRTGLHSSVGAATSGFVAALAARKHRPCGLRIVAPGTESQFLGPFPIDSLRGIPRTHVFALSQGGVSTIGELQRIPKPVLTAAFGAAIGKRIWESVRGIENGDGWHSPIPGGLDLSASEASTGLDCAVS